jgi:hypothetical protein
MPVTHIKQRWIKGTALVAAVYVSLWGATVVFGPEAARSQEKRTHDEYYKLNGLPPSTTLEFASIFVPAPFVVNARWSTYSVASDSSVRDFLRTDESRTLWIFGWTRVLSKRNVVIS